MVKLGNFWYIFFILFAIGLTVGAYFLFKNKSLKAKKILVASLVIFNLFLHFFRLLFPPFAGDPIKIAENAWFINICAVSVLTFPFIFFSKSNAAKDWMFYIGVISGLLALVYPTEALGKSVLTFDLWRFYFCHIIIVMAPLLMVLLKVHTLNYKNIWKMPFFMMAVLLFIICNQVLQSELGIIDMRGTDILKEGCGYRNTSLIWGPTDSVSVLFTWLTPNFMKVIPFGAFAGQAKYWPFFYLVPGCFFYFWLLPLLMCLPWELKHIKADFKEFKIRLKNKKENKENLNKEPENLEEKTGSKKQNNVKIKNESETKKQVKK